MCVVQGGCKYPDTVAFTLWGTDNIKTYGESLAQVREFVHCLYAALSHMLCSCMAEGMRVLEVGWW
jgi:hypothetical protein